MRTCVLVGALLTGCASDDACDLDGISRELGGPGLMDCGLASRDTRAVDRCAVAAHQMRSTFRALYEHEDGSVEAIVHAAGGSYHRLRRMEDGTIERADCSGARVVQDAARRYVACEGTTAFEPVCE